MVSGNTRSLIILYERKVITTNSQDALGRVQLRRKESDVDEVSGETKAQTDASLRQKRFA